MSVISANNHSSVYRRQVDEVKYLGIMRCIIGRQPTNEETMSVFFRPRQQRWQWQPTNEGLWSSLKMCFHAHQRALRDDERLTSGETRNHDINARTPTISTGLSELQVWKKKNNDIKFSSHWNQHRRHRAPPPLFLRTAILTMFLGVSH